MTVRHVLNLPYDKPPLSMNDRGQTPGARARHSRIVAQLRGDACWLAKAAKLPKGLDHVTVQLHYRPRDNRRRDTENLSATSKPLCDGLVDYGLVPDDIPRYMAKPEAVIHSATTGISGEMWLEVSWNTTPSEENQP